MRCFSHQIAYVMPSSSARCAQLPRASDKVPFYGALRRLRDHVVGHVPYLDDADVTFPTLELKNVKREDPGLNAASDEAGGSGRKGAPCPGDAKFSTVDAGNGNLTAQQNGVDANLLPCVKQEGKKKRGRPKGSGKAKGDFSQREARNEEEQQRFTPKTEPQLPTPPVSAPHEQMLRNFLHTQQAALPVAQGGALGLPPYSYSSTDLASLVPASSPSSSQSFPIPIPFSSVPGTSSLPPAPFVAAAVPSSTSLQDFMSGFYPGSLQFGMVGFPNVVASQQQYVPPPTEDSSSGQPVVQVKSEPVELGAQN